MAADPLLAIQRANLVLGAAATAVSGLVWGGRGMLATAAGAALAVANFWAIRRLGGRAAARVASGESIPRAFALVAALVAKMVILCALVWVMIRRLGLPVLPFTVGMSVFVVSILLTGVYRGEGEAGVPAPPPAPPTMNRG